MTSAAAAAAQISVLASAFALVSFSAANRAAQKSMISASPVCSICRYLQNFSSTANSWEELGSAYSYSWGTPGKLKQFSNLPCTLKYLLLFIEADRACLIAFLFVFQTVK